MPIQTEILAPILTLAPLMEAIRAGGARYCEAAYLRRTSALDYLPGDGMAAHAAFNRTVADHLVRHGMEAGLRFFKKTPDDDQYLGDLAAYEPFKGQARFFLSCGNQSYKLLHMTGKLAGGRLDVAGIGVARVEYLLNQNQNVTRSQSWCLPGFADARLSSQPDSAYRLILVTQLHGRARDAFTLDICLSDGQFDRREAVISIVQTHRVMEGLVTEIGAQVAVGRSAQEPPAVVDFEITARA